MSALKRPYLGKSPQSTAYRAQPNPSPRLHTLGRNDEFPQGESSTTSMAKVGRKLFEGEGTQPQQSSPEAYGR